MAFLAPQTRSTPSVLGWIPGALRHTSCAPFPSRCGVPTCVPGCIWRSWPRDVPVGAIGALRSVADPPRILRGVQLDRLRRLERSTAVASSTFSPSYAVGFLEPVRGICISGWPFCILGSECICSVLDRLLGSWMCIRRSSRSLELRRFSDSCFLSSCSLEAIR